MQRTSARKLTITFLITIGILLFEFIGGIISNSLALLSDAGHVFTDAFALGLSMVAARISLRPLDRRATFGYYRVGLLAAVINGLLLVGIASFIFYESYHRFIEPPDIDLAIMMPIAAAGFVANIIMVLILGG
ncbi:MAG: cation diffusion facilitator family transporter, partial [candidate division Zixibacteria bacterium]|nr:cation transporter [candidate division Zixibacteria bacterium]NIU14967.1 cation transporter [candidate division Zixibacteria bacterium]NIV06986.1 cation diffusion facilitator family transporter [candidate division Zixibacteria bacterium]NIW43022.1 cation diffusion facilitator family transporter [candidate division Zixibacteria bacterium]NIX57125.1 cation diffusion facilitator family transporter [candidate division Zixibacteria bacterium]